jgi:hypothetical protein
MQPPSISPRTRIATPRAAIVLSLYYSTLFEVLLLRFKAKRNDCFSADTQSAAESTKLEFSIIARGKRPFLGKVPPGIVTLRRIAQARV